MATGVNPAAVHEGLVFHYDMGNPKSFIGAPTINYMNIWHPRKDASYTPHVANTLPYQWQNNHPDSITVYSQMTDGALGQFVNSGVPDWGNTDHCIWTFDPVLGEPVITMRNFDGSNWKAFYGDHGLNLAAMGYSTGDYYIYSYDQWVSNTTARISPGMYTQNVTSTTSFWDGLGGGVTDAINTKAGEWQRRWCAFTISANHDVTKAYTRFYFYGYNYASNETIKIRRPQLELGTNVASSYTIAPRTTSNSLIDIIDSFVVTPNCSYANNNMFFFDGSGDDVSTNFGDELLLYSNLSAAQAGITNTHPTVYPSGCTYEWWMKVYGAGNNGVGSTGASVLHGSGTICHIELKNESGASPYFRTEARITNNYDFSNGASAPIPGGSLVDRYVNITIVFDNVTSGRPVTWYANGIQFDQKNMEDVADEHFVFFSIGRATGANTNYANSFWGELPVFKIYNKPLTNAEVMRNHNAMRGRFGI